MKPFDVYPVFNIQPEKAQGSWVWDANGRRYLDFYGGHAVISIGHSHPRFEKRISEQLSRIAFYSNSVKMPLQDELSEKLGRLSGYPDYSLFLCNSGAEANENAFKLASFHTGRKKIVAFSGSFHGRTSLAVAATDDKKILAPVNETPNVSIVPFGDMEVAANAINNEVAAVIIEGIQGVAGIRVPSEGFLKFLRQKCDESGAILILDEVQSGYGRSGKFFAHQHADIKPDLITTAKGMGNGFPVGGVLISPKFQAKHGMLGTTFGGSYLACAASLAVLEVLEEENLIENTRVRGEQLIQQLSALPGIREIRGKGLMLGLELETEAATVRNRLLFEKEIFTGGASQKNTVRLLPALNVGDEECNMFMEAITEILSPNKVSA